MKNNGLQTEIDASNLYGKLAEHEPDETIAKVFREMNKIEQGHAEAFALKQKINLSGLMQLSCIPVSGSETSHVKILRAILENERKLQTHN